MMVINKENIEEYLLLLIDGELSKEEEGEVLAFVDSYPEFQMLLDVFLQTKLEDADIVFEDKESLLKHETVVLPIKKKKASLAIAAAVAAFICLGFVFSIIMKTKEQTVPAIASAITIKKVMDTASAQKPIAENRKESEVKQSGKVHFTRHKEKEKSAIALAVSPDRKGAETLKPLPTSNYSAIAITEANENIAINTDRFKPVAVPETEDEPRGWSPINAEKLEIFNALVAQVETLKGELQSKSRSLKITTLAIRLGGKEFTIGK